VQQLLAYLFLGWHRHWATPQQWPTRRRNAGWIGLRTNLAEYLPDVGTASNHYFDTWQCDARTQTKLEY
jgi:hypothetical protein